MVKWLSGSRTNGFQSRSTYQDFQTHHKASSLGEPGVAASHQNQNADVYSLGSLLFKPNFLPKTLIKFLKKRNSLQAWAIHTIYLSIWKLPNMFTVKKKVKKKCLEVPVACHQDLKASEEWAGSGPGRLGSPQQRAAQRSPGNRRIGRGTADHPEDQRTTCARDATIYLAICNNHCSWKKNKAFGKKNSRDLNRPQNSMENWKTSWFSSISPFHW